MRSMTQRFGFSLIIILIMTLFTSAALAQTADEYYGRAAKKYIMEDLSGAKADLQKALELDPGHVKARDLLAVVNKELGAVPPTAPPATRAPATTAAPRITPTTRPPRATRPSPPRPTMPSRTQRASEFFNKAEALFEEGKYEEAKETFEKVLELLPGHQKSIEYIKEIKAKLKPEIKPIPPFVIPPPSKPADVSGTIRELFIILGIFVLVVLYVVFRWAQYIAQKKGAERRMQVCPDCKTRNPEDAEFCLKCGTRLKAWSAISGVKQKWFKKFGWKGNPFTLDVIPALFTGYASQVDSVLDKLSTRSGHILIYGDKGVGKTTMLRWLEANMRKDNHTVYIPRPPIRFDDLINRIVDVIKGKGHREKFSLYDLEGLIKKEKKPVVILLDEAHEVTTEIEQQMRTLGDISGVNHVLAGLPETREKIKKDSPPFFDRIVLEVYIDHLTLEETRDLIKKRIENVGGKDVQPFMPEAIEKIYKMSKGRPRMILKVCDWVISDAIRNNVDVIGTEVGKDFPEHELKEIKPEPNKMQEPPHPEQQKPA